MGTFEKRNFKGTLKGTLGKGALQRTFKGTLRGTFKGTLKGLFQGSLKGTFKKGL